MSSGNRPVTSHEEVDAAYVKNLTLQIAEKKRLLAVAREQLEIAKQSADPAQEADLRYRVVALLENLKRIPYQPSRQDLVHLSLAQKQLKEQTRLAKTESVRVERQTQQLGRDRVSEKLLGELYGEIGERIDAKLQDAQKELDGLTDASPDSRARKLLETIDRLRDRASRLAGYSKLLVSDYILPKEMEVFDYDGEIAQKKHRFLKLLEILINNALESPDDDPKWLEVANKDDPLIRYLIVNNVVDVDGNEIKLRV